MLLALHRLYHRCVLAICWLARFCSNVVLLLAVRTRGPAVDPLTSQLMCNPGLSRPGDADDAPVSPQSVPSTTFSFHKLSHSPAVKLSIYYFHHDFPSTLLQFCLNIGFWLQFQSI